MKKYIGTKMIEAELEDLRWQNENGEIEEKERISGSLSGWI